MKRKALSKPVKAALCTALLYAAVVLIPWGFSQAQGTAPEKPPEPTPAPTAEASPLPGFLEDAQLADADAPEEEVFSLYDEATGEHFTLTEEALIPAAVACEMDLSSPEEALKAQAVACRTHFAHLRDEGEEILCDSARWLTWTTEDEMRARWGESYDVLAATLTECAQAVAGETLTVEGAPIDAAYFAISCGNTEAPENVWGAAIPGTAAASSPGDCLADGYLSQMTFTPQALREAAEAAFPDEPLEADGAPEDLLRDLTYTPSGYVKSAMLLGKAVTGSELRAALGLRSAAAEVRFSDGNVCLTVRGWGHGVGMSQAGAQSMAQRGADYRAILAHYYPGAALTGGEGE